MFAAMLDTSVLWPSRQRDFLLSLAVEQLYRPLWSEAVLEELERHEYLKLLNRGADDSKATARTAYLLGQMRAAFPDAIVTDWEPLDGSYGLPDPDDEHVVAAAVVGGAGVIVTENRKHFPQALMPRGIQVLDAADFTAETVSISPARALRAVRELCHRLTDPAMSEVDLLHLLEQRYRMSDAVDLMREEELRK